MASPIPPSPGPDPPLGITQLEAADRVQVLQKSCTGSKYEVVDVAGQTLLLGRGDSNALGQMLGGTNRAFNIDVFDTQDRLIMKIRRPYTFGPDKMEVWVCGRLGSVVRQEMTFLKPVLTLNDAGDQPVLRVKGPVNTAGECDFDILNLDKKKVGVIRKQWGKSREEKGESFRIQFPPQLDVRYKAAVVATCFLIDFLYYES